MTMAIEVRPDAYDDTVVFLLGDRLMRRRTP